MTISIKNLIKKYKEKTALAGISFTVSSGETLGLLGPNGAGKTTLLMTLAGLRYPTTGEVIIGETVVSPRTRTNILRNIGIVFQENSLDLEKTIYDNLLLHCTFFSLPESWIEDRLEEFTLLHLKDRIVSTLSGGERRRVEIAKVLLHKPKILLLDEPSLGLDVVMRNQVWEEIHKLKDVTVIIASNNLHEIERLCDRVIIINKGEVHYDEKIDNQTKELVVTCDTSLSEHLLQQYSYTQRKNQYFIKIKDQDAMIHLIANLKESRIVSLSYGHHLENRYLEIVGEQ